MLYIIGVDPLLSSLQQTPRISGVSGFVDDWSMGCHGMLAISAVSNLIHRFEQASGQQINRGKSALIPARQLSDAERASCLAVWNSNIRISSCERVLGVFIGIHASIHDQYNNAVNKYDMALSVFGRVRTSLSLAMRVFVVNIFMFTLFSYPNRHFFMPRVLLQEIERKVLRFLTPITWTKLGMFSAVGTLYGTQTFLQDLGLSDVDSVFSTHEAWIDIRRGTISALGRWRRRHTFLPNPAISWEGCVRFFPAYCRNYTFRRFVRNWASSSKTTFSVLCINGWLVQNSIVGKLAWDVGCKPKDGMVQCCVAHNDTCQGVCLNHTDGFC